MEDVIQGRRFCYTIVPGQDPKVHGGFMPSMVVEGEKGKFPMQGGDHEWAAPWIWGKTEEEAIATCNRYNKRLGISEKVAWEIERSTFEVFDDDED